MQVRAEPGFAQAAGGLLRQQPVLKAAARKGDILNSDSRGNFRNGTRKTIMKHQGRFCAFTASGDIGN